MFIMLVCSSLNSLLCIQEGFRLPRKAIVSHMGPAERLTLSRAA